MGPCAALPHHARERESLYAMTDRPDRETLPYRDCVGVAVFNANGNVLVGHRKSEGDHAKQHGGNEPARPLGAGLYGR